MTEKTAAAQPSTPPAAIDPMVLQAILAHRPPAEFPPIEYLEKLAALAKAHDLSIVVHPGMVQICPIPSQQLGGIGMIPGRLGAPFPG